MKAATRFSRVGFRTLKAAGMTGPPVQESANSVPVEMVLLAPIQRRFRVMQIAECEELSFCN
jgi:hypothetical protein